MAATADFAWNARDDILYFHTVSAMSATSLAQRPPSDPVLPPSTPAVPLSTPHVAVAAVPAALPRLPGPPADRRFYYLHNFQFALDWILARYDDLLDIAERDFIARFPLLPLAARALLVRLLMRKGPVFRMDGLVYTEIGCVRTAARPLLDLGWLDPDPVLTLDQVFHLLKRAELPGFFHAIDARIPARATKTSWMDGLRPLWPRAHRWSEWKRGGGLPSREGAWRGADGSDQEAATRTADLDDQAYEQAPASGYAAEKAREHAPAVFHSEDDTCDVVAVGIAGMVERFRLMFFGNLRQAWSEFVLADLGIFRYENVAFPLEARAFQAREDVDTYLRLHRQRESFESGEPWENVWTAVHAEAPANPWLARRRDKLLFALGRHCESRQAWPEAQRIYRSCGYPGTRHRLARVLEHSGDHAGAMALAEQALLSPENEAETQLMQRLHARASRRLQAVRERTGPAWTSPPRTDLLLARPTPFLSVEHATREALSRPDAPVFYVENTLVTGLFGLLCWPAVFLPVAGAFFHPYQRGPADLHGPDFVESRRAAFQECLARLDDGTHRAAIMDVFHAKAGIQSPFVSWHALDADLLRLALDCVPAAHMKRWFQRVLADIGNHCTGWPDLIQFWPGERRYALIEVKGPGDRLQDNQRRTLSYLLAHGIPAGVCHVAWRGADA
ncbi:VRR-NUC domain-containing protein [Bordetella bronchialis]|uniref:phosphodiesterase I n=2 Tax=Bordetella bronchialis TaxID=463025 RepID=A0ABM6CPX7_9BORD|nr:hypothetical protein BAU06_06770 [Bordetella bronchialis]